MYSLVAHEKRKLLDFKWKVFKKLLFLFYLPLRYHFEFFFFILLLFFLILFFCEKIMFFSFYGLKNKIPRKKYTVISWFSLAVIGSYWFGNFFIPRRITVRLGLFNYILCFKKWDCYFLFDFIELCRIFFYAAFFLLQALTTWFNKLTFLF